MSAHEYASGGVSWNPALRTDSASLAEQARNQPEPPVIIPEEVEEAIPLDNVAEREHVDGFYSGHAGASNEDPLAHAEARLDKPEEPEEPAVEQSAPNAVGPGVEESEGHDEAAPAPEAEEAPLDTTDAQTVASAGDNPVSQTPEDDATEDEKPRGRAPAPSELYAPTHAVATPDSHLREASQPDTETLALESAPEELGQELQALAKYAGAEQENQTTAMSAEQERAVQPTLEPEEAEQQGHDAARDPPTLFPDASHNLPDNTPQAHDESLLEQEVPQAELEHSDGQRADNEYEYQGETTAADDAVTESAEASLLADEEAMPTAQDAPTPMEAPAAPLTALPDPVQEVIREEKHEAPQPTAPVAFAWGTEEQDGTFDLGIQSQTAQPPSEAFWGETDADDTFDALGIQTQPEQPGAPGELPQQEAAALFDDVEGDDTFEALAAQASTPQQQPEEWTTVKNNHTFETEDGPVAASQATALEQVLQEFGQEAPTVETAESVKPQEDDLAAMWSAALDDDELLDESDSVDPSGFFEDDGEGFLDDFEPNQPDVLSPSQPVPVVDSQGVTQGFTAAGQASALGASRYTPAQTQQQRERIPNPLTSPEFFSSSRMPALAAAAPPVYGAYGQSPYTAAVQPLQPQRPAGPHTAQSFVDKSKGGYASPYDLPEDIVQPRTRSVRPAAAPVVQAPAPPPRLSSMAPLPPPLSRAPTAASVDGPSLPSASRSGSSQPPQTRPSTGDKQDFFADLPIVPKLRSRPSGVYTPGPTGIISSLPQAPPMRPGTMPPRSGTPPTSMSSQAYGGLQHPDRLPLLPNESAAEPRQLQPPPSAPSMNGRYSPAAPVTGAALSAPPASTARFSPAPPSNPPAAVSRYSPAPASHPATQASNKFAPASQAQRPNLPFAPRTSSPLTFAEKPNPEVPGPPVSSMSYQPGPAAAPVHIPPTNAAPPSRRGSEQVDHSAPLHQVQSRTYAPPTAPEGYQNMLASPPRVNPYAPSLSSSPESRRSQPFTPAETNTQGYMFSPPHRPHTQSPGTVMKGPLRAITQVERPTSAAGVTSPTTVRQQDTRHTLHPARRQFSADLSYARPQDERAADGLERWKGSPIISWSPSGALVTSFPKQAPFYAAGHAIPTIKCTPGPVTIHDSKTTYPMDERNAKFPGPFSLKGKGKKKEIVSWVTGKIEDLTKTYEEAMLDFDTPQVTKRRLEEKVILWKMTKLFLENDNKVEGVAPAEAEARNILLPNLAKSDEAADELVGSAIGLQQEPVSSNALAQIRKRLLNGNREDAVWYATEQKLWSHALLIASVSGPDLWKQVVQEFVRAQVKDAGENSQSLAALYEVFAGNWDESIDELVPPSARAGFQMISKTGPSVKNPLDGLDQWRETLGLIISNRSSNDIQAVTALGKLLSKYGRVEAAHTCFLFARASAKWGGADDTTSDFVLLGADHQNQSHELVLDLDAILLTEIYEYLLSLAPTAGASAVHPHLQSYKLHHAFTLAEHGLRSEAQAYCDSISAAVKSSTRASPYYHAGLMSQVDDLSRCLSAAPQPTNSSWISKPSMDKVSGSMWKRFNTFVAGDEDGDAANGATPGSEGKEAAGPFGKLTGDTPTMSREGSVTDLYSAMSMNGNISSPSIMSSSAPSKYAPINAAAARVPSEHAAPSKYAPAAAHAYSPRGSLESTRSDFQERPGTGYSSYTGLQPQPPLPRASSTPFGAYLPQGQQVAEPQPPQQGGLGVPRPEAARAVSDYRVHYSQPPSRRESVQSGASGYSPRPSVEQSRYSPRPPLEQNQSSYGFSSQLAHAGSPYQSGGAYTPSIPAYGEDGGEESQGHGHHSYDSVPQQPLYHDQGSAPSFEPPQASFDSPHTPYEPPQASYAPPEPSYEPSLASFEAPTSGYEPPSSSYTHQEGPTDEQSSSYAPPTSYAPPSSYEPPSSSYQPYEPEPDPEDGPADPSAPAPKKKSIMDLDDDEDDAAGLAARAAALKAQQKREADKQADDAFRAAAEADAARDKQSPNPAGGKKGWFGGWFKKGDGSLDQQSQGGQQQGNKPIRAKLGEENSFYYDADLKKWVNKKGGSTPDAGAGAGTPPPPKGPSQRGAGVLAPPGPPGPPGSGPPSRVASGSGAPPPIGMGAGSGPPSRIGTPGAGAMSPPAVSGVASAVPPGLASGPPSRPATSMSNASSIDDLLGAPAPRKGAGGKKAKRGGRYVDVMAK